MLIGTLCRHGKQIFKINALALEEQFNEILNNDDDIIQYIGTTWPMTTDEN